MEKPVLTLHVANKTYSSWSLRPWILLKTLGVEFREVVHCFGDASYGVVTSGLLPALEVGVGEGRFVVWDSLAIVEYVAEVDARMWPRDARARAWARSACAEMHSGFGALRANCPMNLAVRARLSPEVLAAIAKDVKRMSALLSEGLRLFSGPFLCGSSFCAADAFYTPIACRRQTYAVDFGDAAVNAYLDSLLTSAAYKEWDAASALETFVDPSEEPDSEGNGRTLLHDRRKKKA